MNHCSQCGHQLSANDYYCVNCGASANNPTGEKTIYQAKSHEETENPKQHSGKRPGFITLIGILLALFLTAGGWWGWRSYGSPEVRVQKQLDLAVKYVSENNFEQAVLAYNEAIRIDPKEGKAYQGLARVYTIQNKYDEAQSTYERGLGEVAEDQKGSLRLGLAGMYIDRNDLAAAEKLYKELISQDKTLIDAYQGLAIVCQQKGDQALAVSILRQAVANNPDNYRAYNVLALFLKQNNQTEDAYNNLVKSLALEVNQQEAYVVLTDIYQGHWPELLAKMTSLNDLPTASMLEFFSYYSSENYPKAISFYQEKLVSHADNQKAMVLAAIAMVKNGDKVGAEAIINQLGKYHLNEWLLSDVARYYLAAGDQVKAREYAVKALDANSFNLDAIALLQTLNSDDPITKIYTAQALIYNWKPVKTVQKELLFEKKDSIPNSTQVAPDNATTAPTKQISPNNPTQTVENASNGSIPDVPPGANIMWTKHTNEWDAIVFEVPFDSPELLVRNTKGQIYYKVIHMSSLSGVSYFDCNKDGKMECILQGHDGSGGFSYIYMYTIDSTGPKEVNLDFGSFGTDTIIVKDINGDGVCEIVSKENPPFYAYWNGSKYIR